MSLDVEPLLRDTLLKNRADKKIARIKIDNLVKPGENNGGELLDIKITLIDVNEKNVNEKEEEIISVVGKKIPRDETARKIFNVQQTFKGEINFYTKIAPALIKFQKEHNIQSVLDCFGEFYGSRINRNGTEIVDREGVILMENLKLSGYKNVDKKLGFDLNEAKGVLKDLASLHGIPLAIKLKKRAYFDAEIRVLMDNELKSNYGKAAFTRAGRFVERVLSGSDKSAPHVRKIMKLWDTYKLGPKYTVREPFATLSHGDLWANNIMVKNVAGKSSNKFVDFQTFNYKSPALDLLNFLLTSVNLGVLKEEFDNLLEWYHRCLIDVLEGFKCGDLEKFKYVTVDFLCIDAETKRAVYYEALTEMFKYSVFEEELARESGRVFARVILFLPFVVYRNVEDGVDVLNDDLSDNVVVDKLVKGLSVEGKEKMWFMVEMYQRKNWFKEYSLSE